MSDEGDEEAASILLDDTRSRRISQAGSEAQDPERQFLVGNDEDGDEHLEDEVRSFRSSTSMDDDRDGRKHKYGSLMQNDSARMSHLDVHGAGSSQTHLEVGVLDGSKPRDGNLAAKAGIILVSAFDNPTFLLVSDFIRTGDTQRFYRHTPVHHHRNIINYFCHRRCKRVARTTTAERELDVTGAISERRPWPFRWRPKLLCLCFPVRVVYIVTIFTQTSSSTGTCSLGGVSAVVAFVLTVRLARHLKHTA